MSSFRQWARQRRFPPEFRISEPQARPTATEGEPKALPEPERISESSDLDDKTIAYVVTNLWRVLKRFGENEDGEAPKKQRLAMRNLIAMSDRLHNAGVRVQDHEGMEWDPGLALEVIAYVPRPNLDRETVVRTERPTVYRGKRCIQFGQVTVGVPEKGQSNGTREH